MRLCKIRSRNYILKTAYCNIVNIVSNIITNNYNLCNTSVYILYSIQQTIEKYMYRLYRPGGYGITNPYFKKTWTRYYTLSTFILYNLEIQNVKRFKTSKYIKFRHPEYLQKCVYHTYYRCKIKKKKLRLISDYR